jgi:hypothetical protein
MARILWLTWVPHCDRPHGVTAQPFEEAWDDPDRAELAEEDDPEWGTASGASARPLSDRHVVELVWRWQHHDGGGAVWPITAGLRAADSHGASAATAEA